MFHGGTVSAFARGVKGIPILGQGNRVKESSCDETCEEVVVPAGGFAL
jgi:hypothetical protein